MGLIHVNLLMNRAAIPNAVNGPCLGLLILLSNRAARFSFALSKLVMN